MNIWQEWVARIFPVRIERDGGTLRIYDRRPSDAFILSILVVTGSLLFSVWIFRPLVEVGVYWPLVLLFLPAPIFAVKALLSPLRATHIFDSQKDQYILSQRTILKNRSSEGSVSQIRGAQVERRVVTSNEDLRKSEVYRTVLLLNQGMLFGGSDVIPVRENSTIAVYYQTESQIANAISSYLKLSGVQLVDMGEA